MRRQTLTAAAVGILILVLAPQAGAVPGHTAFEPIGGSAYDQLTANWKKPWKIPASCTQKRVSDETVLNIYDVDAKGQPIDDLTDMNTVNETGRRAGRYLYRTHEVGSDGSVSVVDLKTGHTKVLIQDEFNFQRLDGLTWTPWGTLLFAEEQSVEGTPTGRLFEAFLDPKDPTRVTRVVARPKLGILRHEGIGVAPDGSVNVVDEFNGGSIYRFVPTRPGDLSDGKLYALKITGLAPPAQAWDEKTFRDKVGAFEWVELNIKDATTNAKKAADDVNATEFGRPEDVQIIGNVLHVANTTEDRVVAIDLKQLKLTSFVQAGDNVKAEDKVNKVTGLNSPDNLAKGPDGRLWIVEDNVPSDIWVASRGTSKTGLAKNVELFASLKDAGAEGSGIYFGKDDHTLFVNIQHPDKPLADGTWAITCR